MASISFFTSVEFYVIITVVAAAVVAFASRPGAHGPVHEHLLAGELADSVPGSQPSLEIECMASGRVMLIRRCVEGITDSGAVSLAVTVKGTDVMVEERLTPGRGALMGPVDAFFMLQLRNEERYHIRYNSQKTGLFAAFSLHVRQGLRTTKALAR